MTTVESEVQKFYQRVMERHDKSASDGMKYLWGILHANLRTPEAQQLLFAKLPPEYQQVKSEFDAKKIADEQFHAKLKLEWEQRERQRAERIAELNKQGQSLFTFSVETTQDVIKRKVCEAYYRLTGVIEVIAATKEEAFAKIENGEFDEKQFECVDHEEIRCDDWEWEEDEEGDIDFDDAEYTLTNINGEAA